MQFYSFGVLPCFLITYKHMELFFDYLMILTYSSSKNVLSARCLPGPVLRDTAEDKINKSQLLPSQSFSREGQRTHPKKHEVG